MQEEIHDFAVYPLEGIMTKINGDYLEQSKTGIYLSQTARFHSEEMVNKALGMVRIKKPNPLLEEIHFETMQNGLCVEVLMLVLLTMNPYLLKNGSIFSSTWFAAFRELSQRNIFKQRKPC